MNETSRPDDPRPPTTHGPQDVTTPTPTWASNPAGRPTWAATEPNAATDAPHAAVSASPPAPPAGVDTAPRSRRPVRLFPVLLGLTAIAVAVLAGLHHGGILRIDWASAGPPTLLGFGALLVVAGALGLRQGRHPRT